MWMNVREWQVYRDCHLANSCLAINVVETWGESLGHRGRTCTSRQAAMGAGQCRDRHPEGGSVKLSEGARVKKWVCRFGIYKHMDDGHTHGPGPAGDHWSQVQRRRLALSLIIPKCLWSRRKANTPHRISSQPPARTLNVKAGMWHP